MRAAPITPFKNGDPSALLIAVVVWVIVALGVAMVIYIDCWWRHLKPEPTPH